MRSLFTVLALVVASSGIGSAQTESAGGQRQAERVVVELTTEDFIGDKTVVPVDTKQAVGAGNNILTVCDGAGSPGCESITKKWSYVISVYRIEKKKVFLKLRVTQNSGSRIDKRFSVSRVGVSEYEFEGGIKIRAYFEP